jgi:predicted ester cyclase/heme-degrading monooxygenase HmoA
MVTIPRNKVVIGKLYEQVLNGRKMELLPDLISQDYVGPGGVQGLTGFKAPLVALLEAFANVQWKVEAMVEEGNKVVVSQHMQGTHTSSFQHIAATGRSVSTTAIAIYTLQEGKIITHQILTDRLGFLQQLGVLPFEMASLPKEQVAKDQVSFIDKFFVPAAAKDAFFERMRMNRNFIKTLPGFVEDAVYEHMDQPGNLHCLTVAKWESQAAVESAKQAVQAEYKKQGFDVTQFFQRLGITMDRAIYRQTESSN